MSAQVLCALKEDLAKNTVDLVARQRYSTIKSGIERVRQGRGDMWVLVCVCVCVCVCLCVCVCVAYVLECCVSRGRRWMCDDN